MQKQISSYRWLIFILAAIAYVLAVIHRMSLAVLTEPIMTDLQVNAAFMGLLASAYYYPYAILQVLSGILSDKASPKKLIIFSLICMSIGGFLFSIATNASFAFMARLLVGIGCALVVMPTYKIIANWFSKKNYAFVLSCFISISFGVGTMLSSKPLSLSIEALGWRITVQGICYLGLIMAVIFFLFFKDKPKNPIEEIEKKEEKVEELENISVKEALIKVITKGNFWYVTFAFTMNSAVMFAFIGLWGASYYTNVVGLSQAEMSSLLTVAASLTIISPIIFAGIATRVQSRKKILIVANLLLVIMFAYLTLRNGFFSKTEIYIWALCLSAVTSAPSGIYMATIRELFPRNIASTANGIGYSLCMLGAAIFQPLIGLMLTLYSTTGINAQAFYPVCLLYLSSSCIAVVLSLLLKEKDYQLI